MGGDWRYPPPSWGGAGRSSSHDHSWNSRPPLPPGSAHCSIPLWEKKFITIGCTIPWNRFCHSMSIINRESNVFKWDDSAALEAFQNAKARFEAHCFGYACDIPLPDPYMYIDEVDYHSFVDPELVADLENPTVPSFRVNADVLVRNLNIKNSGNWDDLIEKPLKVDNTWENSAAINSSSWRVGDWHNNGWNGGKGAAAWGNAVPADASWNNQRFNYQNHGISTPTKNKNWLDGEVAASWGKDWHGVEGTAAWGVGEGTAAWGNGVLEDASWSSKRFNYGKDGRTTPLKNKDRASDRGHGRKRHGGFWSDSRFTRIKY